MPKKIAKFKREGLHLWLVKSPAYHLKLWITTRYKSVTQASDKARTWLKRNTNVTFPRIDSIENHGTIDA